MIVINEAKLTFSNRDSYYNKRPSSHIEFKKKIGDNTFKDILKKVIESKN